MNDIKRCFILGRKDLAMPVRHLPLDQVKLRHILPSSMSKQQIKDAQLIVVKVSNVEGVTLKDALPEQVEPEPEVVD